MKNTKRFAAFVASVLAVAAMAVPMTSVYTASADTTITINSTNENHTYQVYQIFKGTLEDNVLTGITWGANVDSTALTAEGATFNGKTASEAAAMLNDENVQSMAAVFGAALTGTPTEKKVAEGATSVTIDLAEDGYYLVQDKATSLDGKNDAMTRYIVRVAGVANVVSPKSSVPSVMKKVKEDTNTVTGTATIGDFTEDDTANGTWNDVADYDIGDAVPFKLYGTMPSTIGDYSKYKYVFHDKLGSEFDAPANTAVAVKVLNKNADGEYVATAVTPTSVVVDGNDITVTFNDIKSAATVKADTIVTVEYNAVLNKTAKIGRPGQNNEVYLTYSNNPNWTGTGDATPDDKGKTPEDKVIVFTYGIHIDKDFVNAGTPLTPAEITENVYGGVKFNLYKGETVTESSVPLKFTKDTDDNKYYLDSTSTNADIEITAECIADIKGLDEGTYTLVEKEAPAGFNKAPNAKITVTAGTENNQGWEFANKTTMEAATSALTSFTYQVDAGEVKDGVTTGTANVTIINEKGSSLPSTGGMGTTLFVVGGGVTAALAGVYLISKKRAKND